MWGVVAWFGRAAWWVFRWGYMLPGFVGYIIRSAGRDLEAALRDRRARGVAPYPLLNYITLIALGVVVPIFEAGFISRAAMELTDLVKAFIAGAAARRTLAKLGPRVKEVLIMPYYQVVGQWLVDWLFTPGWRL